MTYNIGLPGGMNGPFYSIIKSNGNIVAMQITEKKYAEMIKTMGDAMEGDFDTTHAAGKRLSKILKRDKVKVPTGSEDYLIQAVMEALFNDN
jgi:hypothetical protein